MTKRRKGNEILIIYVLFCEIIISKQKEQQCNIINIANKKKRKKNLLVCYHKKM